MKHIYGKQKINLKAISLKCLGSAEWFGVKKWISYGVVRVFVYKPPKIDIESTSDDLEHDMSFLQGCILRFHVKLAGCNLYVKSGQAKKTRVLPSTNSNSGSAMVPVDSPRRFPSLSSIRSQGSGARSGYDSWVRSQGGIFPYGCFQK